jgi:tetratricopeptide (TPR) repeat protein
LAGLDLPTSIYSLILSRVDQLNERQQITLKVASVIGRLFPAAMVWGVYPELGDMNGLLGDLQLLSEMELTALDAPEPELTYLFKHVLTQEVAYESLPFATRAVLHGQIGAYIEETYAGSLDRYVDLLAHHYDRSENDAKRREYLLKAGEAAQANYANATAVDYYRRLLPHLPRPEKAQVLLRLGQVLDWIGEYEEAETSYRKALSLARESGDGPSQAQCQIAIGELARKQSDYGQAMRWFVRAQDTARQNDDRAGVAKALICIGSLAFYQGNYDEATGTYQRSLTLRRQMQDRQNEANVLNNLGIVAASQGDFERAEDLFGESLTIRRALQQKWAIANSLGNLGQLAIDRQQTDKALAYLEEALRLHRETGDRWRIGNALHSLANIQRAKGNHAAAHAYYCESLQITSDLADRRQLAYLLEDLGGLSAQRGRAARALRLAGAGAALREAIGAPLSPTDQTKLDLALAPARQALDAEAQRAAWDAGRALPLEEAIEEATQEANAPTEL